MYNQVYREHGHMPLFILPGLLAVFWGSPRNPVPVALAYCCST